MLRALGPLAALGTVLVAGVALHMIKGKKAQLQWSVLNTLPALLFIVFCLTPTTSTSIFAAWTCESFHSDSTVDPPTVVKYLRKDLSLKCDLSDHDYSRVVSLAYMFVVVCELQLLLASPPLIAHYHIRAACNFWQGPSVDHCSSCW